MTDEGKRIKHDPEICEELRVSIEENCLTRLGDLIKEALESGDDWKANSLRQTAQREFNLMVTSNGECTSVYADVREAFTQFSGLEGYKPHDRKAQLEEHYRVTEDPETGEFSIAPKVVTYG